jgi:alkanesulfonate monooxygenase SsuD/methylene tetrahydromethanopterin reductase-like flavin-dependent oxidoreductase (luciferase family)
MLIDRFILGSRQTPIVGSPSQVADALQRWVAEADVDGFNLSRTVMPGMSGGLYRAGHSGTARARAL